MITPSIGEITRGDATAMIAATRHRGLSGLSRGPIATVRRTAVLAPQGQITP